MEGHAAAVELDGAFCAAEFYAAVVNAGGHHAFVDYVETFILRTLVAEGGLEGVWAVPFFEDVFVGEHEGMSGLVGLHG